MVYASGISVGCPQKIHAISVPLSQSPEQRMGQRRPPPRPAVAHGLRPTARRRDVGSYGSL